MIRELGVRRWIAWQLVQLAWKVWHHEWVQRIQIRNAAGELVIEWEIAADTYSGGISSQSCPKGFGDYTVSIDEGEYPPGPAKLWPDDWDMTWEPSAFARFY